MIFLINSFKCWRKNFRIIIKETNMTRTTAKTTKSFVKSSYKLRSSDKMGAPKTKRIQRTRSIERTIQEGVKFDEHQRTKKLKIVLLSRRTRALMNARMAITRWAVPSGVKVFAMRSINRKNGPTLFVPDYLRY